MWIIIVTAWLLLGLLGSYLGARHFKQKITDDPFYIVVIILGLANLIGALSILGRNDFK